LKIFSVIEIMTVNVLCESFALHSLLFGSPDTSMHKFQVSILHKNTFLFTITVDQ